MQNQQKIEWPAQLVVAKAYVDQLARSQALPAKQITALQKAIAQRREVAHERGKVAAYSALSASPWKESGTTTTSSDDAQNCVRWRIS